MREPFFTGWSFRSLADSGSRVFFIVFKLRKTICTSWLVEFVTDRFMKINERKFVFLMTVHGEILKKKHYICALKNDKDSIFPIKNKV